MHRHLTNDSRVSFGVFQRTASTNVPGLAISLPFDSVFKITIDLESDCVKS